jgi:hypothetical protein
MGLCRYAAGTVLLMALLAGGTRAADVYGVRVDPPRVYLTHASLNRSGTLSALRGQDNVLSLYMPPVDNAKGAYTPEGFSLVVLLPGFLEVLDQAEQGLAVTPVQHEGQPCQQVAKALDPVQVKSRCFDNTWGLHEAGPIWFRVRAEAQVPEEPVPARVTLRHRDRECFTDTARLRVFEAIPPGPRVSWRSFRLWLHYGPHYRRGHWDELAEYLRLAGINGIQATVGGPDGLEYVQAMRERGFYIIAQRGGSYGDIYKDNMRACLEQGPAWFGKADQGTMQTYLPLSHAALWDFEPSPLPTGVDEWLVAQFRQAQQLPADEDLTEATIRARYLRPWIEFRQAQLATCIRHWADHCRSVKPDVETILTEGGVLAFDPPGQVDYSTYQDYVTFCDPMNFTGMQALQVVRQWQQRAPRATFTGCQNVALSSYHTVFISPQTIMLQTLSAALIGLRGTSVYPGPAMEAENFRLWARVTGFLGRHESVIFGGRRDPVEVKLGLVPKEEQEVILGDGRRLRNCYPDWEREAICRSYAAADASEFLTVVVNWHAKEPAYGRLSLTLPAGPWLLVDDENREVFTHAGNRELAAGLLAEGVAVRCPAFDYRGFRALRISPAALAAVKDYQPQHLETWAAEVRAYVQAATATAAATGSGETTLGFDDADGDGAFEYVVQSPAQKAWVSQSGTVLRWQVGAQTLEGEALGLCRDMLWLPLGERESRGLDAVMRLEGKETRPDGSALTFSRDVPLATLGGGASVRLLKDLVFAKSAGDLSVRVRLANTSVAPEATRLTCSYRVHHYLRYGPSPNVFWASDGAALRHWDKVDAHLTVPNTGLTPAETDCLFAQCEVAPPLRPVACGDHRPEGGLLLTAVPARPDEVLQLLRWGRRPGMAGGATIEWMYRPTALAVGQDLTYEYRLTLQTDVAALTADSARTPTPAPARDEARLLLHLGFDGTTEPLVAGGAREVAVTGTPTYEDTPGGQAIRLSQGLGLSYLPAGNIDLRRGRLAIRFKPLWEGAENQSRFLLTVRPRTGFVYLGKLDDGRFLMNFLDANDGQHYAGHSVRTMVANTWHEAVVTWEAPRGVSILFLDGEKVAEFRAEPWTMADLDNSLAHSRLVFPKEAEAVIDDVRIWDRP